MLQPVVLTLPSNGLRLRFDGSQQRLRLIEVLDFSMATLTYKNHDLVKRSKPSEDATLTQENQTGPPFRHIYNRLFGPAYEGEYIPPDSGNSNGTYVLSYPGLALSFPVKHKSWSNKVDFVSLLSSSATSPATSMSIFSGSSWPEIRASLYGISPPLLKNPVLAGRGAESRPDEVEEVRLHGGGRLEFIRRTSQPVAVNLSETTPQDLVADFGPPDAIYHKNDNRFSIHARNASQRRRPSVSPGLDPHDTDQSSTQSYTDDSEVDSPSGAEMKQSEVECFYNYFHHGFDALISFPTSKSSRFPGTEGQRPPLNSSASLVVTKIILHGNVPGSYSFNRHSRSRWSICLPSNAEQEVLSSETAFSAVSLTLSRIWHDTYGSPEDEQRMQRGMVLNRGWDESPGSSIELLGGFEDGPDASRRSPGNPRDSVASLNNTELYGFPGMLFEVLKNDTVSCVMIY